MLWICGCAECLSWRCDFRRAQTEILAPARSRAERLVLAGEGQGRPGRLRAEARGMLRRHDPRAWRAIRARNPDPEARREADHLLTDEQVIRMMGGKPKLAARGAGEER